MHWRWIYNAKILQIQHWAKEARAQIVHNRWFHLYIFFKWTDPIYDFRSQDSSPFGRREGIWLGEVTNGVSESNGNSLFPDLDNSYAALFTLWQFVKLYVLTYALFCMYATVNKTERKKKTLNIRANDNNIYKILLKNNTNVLIKGQWWICL